jgi:hypothetical protein
VIKLRPGKPGEPLAIYIGNKSGLMKQTITSEIRKMNVYALLKDLSNQFVNSEDPKMVCF